MQHDDPAKTTVPPTKPAQPRIPDGTVPHNVPPPRKPTEADPGPARPSFDRGDRGDGLPGTVRRDG